jgi:hypothetical protein
VRYWYSSGISSGPSNDGGSAAGSEGHPSAPCVLRKQFFTLERSSPLSPSQSCASPHVRSRTPFSRMLHCRSRQVANPERSIAAVANLTKERRTGRSCAASEYLRPKLSHLGDCIMFFLSGQSAMRSLCSKRPRCPKRSLEARAFFLDAVLAPVPLSPALEIRRCGSIDVHRHGFPVGWEDGRHSLRQFDSAAENGRQIEVKQPALRRCKWYSRRTSGV